MDDRIAMGIKHYNAKRYEKALAEFQSCEADPAQNADLAYYTGLALTKLEKYDDALIYLEQVVTTHKSFLHVYQSRMILGYIYAITNRYRLAEFEFQKLLEAGLESTQIYASMGYISYSQGKTEESVDYLKKALKLDPLYANALNSLGYIYAEEGIELVKALEYCKKASELKPENSAYLDSLGWAYYKLGDYREAHQCLRKALDLSPGTKEIARHLKAVMGKNKYL
jgi:tetratricopeptide (TPR) repeat protein